ncbi:MAG TPA: alkaline phosphatase family protein [Pyrinomonadaceae bacterium]|nr:alkaline phosphatase family protein [Pyrinomonadaceae bacterium]
MKLNLRVRNRTGGRATITVAHLGSVNEAVELHVWRDMQPEETSDPVEINFDPGAAGNADKWFVSAAVRDGLAPGIYETAGSRTRPLLKWNLPVSAADQSPIMTVSGGNFRLLLPTSQFNGQLDKSGPFTEQIRNVFVLMLENRSFDHIFGWSGLQARGANRGAAPEIEGCKPQPHEGDPTFSNVFNDQTIVCAPVTAAAMNLSADPGHEWEDVMESLGGTGAALGANGSYPDINRSGYVASYARALQKAGVARDAQHLGEIMSGVARESRLILHQIAEQYAICDHWFCSLPGPTWPNRLFALAGSSGGLEVSPYKGQMFASEYLRGFTMDHGSIFSALLEAKLNYRIYKDHDNSFATAPAGRGGFGGGTIAAALTGVHRASVRRFSSFAEDLQGRYPYQFTFIEPHYGDAAHDTYFGGSSQHPMDNLESGERLIAATYKAIRNSSHWEHSLLIITYDEHGGLFDHVTPPATVAPSDSRNYSRRGFDFKRLGPRVAAVIVSPRIPPFTVDKNTYDHTSIIKTVFSLFSPNTFLTERDRQARDLGALFDHELRPENDCPLSFDVPDMQEKRSFPNQVARDADPLPESGNVIGFVHLAAKTDFELSDGSQETADAIVQKIKGFQTHGDARAYVEDVLTRSSDDETDGDKIDELIYGTAADVLIAEIAGDVSMEVSDLDRLLTMVFATSFKRNLNTDGLKSERVGLLMQKVEEYEANRTEIIDSEDDVYMIPRGTSVLLRTWS